MDKIVPFIKKKGVGKMSTAMLEKENSIQKSDCMANIRRLIQCSMEEKKITPKEARKSLEIKRYEK